MSTAEQEIERITELLQQASSLIQQMKKTRTFATSWNTLGMIKDHIDEGVEALNEFVVKFQEKED